MNRIIEEVNTYDYTTDIYIHTNNSFDYTHIVKNRNGHIFLIVHNLSGIDPFQLTWKCRSYMREQLYDYDIFIYLEDDILIPKQVIRYWLVHKDNALKHNYNIGFIRIETDATGDEFMTDIISKFNNKITLHDNYGVPTTYADKGGFIYSACWICDRTEFYRFIQSDNYILNETNIESFILKKENKNLNMSRELSAIGMNDTGIGFYKGVLIPLRDNNLHPDCRIYHMPNNYVSDMDVPFAKIKFENAFELLSHP